MRPNETPSLLLPLAPLALLAAPALLGPAACQDAGVSRADQLRASLTAEPSSLEVGGSVFFDAGASTDEQGVEARFADTEISSFTFDFGDGVVVESELFYVQHVYASAGTFTVSVTVSDGRGESGASLEVLVSWPPPTVAEVDVSGDGKAVIGEWIELRGRGFRAENLPAVDFQGVDAQAIEFMDEFTIAVQVPPRAPSGPVTMGVDFPQDDGGDAAFDVDVARYALATDAWRGRAYVVEFAGGSSWEIHSQTLELPNAALVRVSGDGAFALLGDARFQAALTPSVKVVDMTADWHPVVVADLTNLGQGPLFDIALARDLPLAVVTDATGFVVLDLEDPTAPVQVGERETYDFSEMAPTAIALSADGSRLAVLSTFNDRVRFYSITPTGPIYEDDSVTVGEGAQDMDSAGDLDLLYVLGGGGEGAIPPDFSIDNSTITAVDWSGWPPENAHGDGNFVNLGGSVPIPIDLAVAPSGKAWVSTLDSNLAGVLGAFQDLASDPAELGAWQSLVETLGGIGFGAVVPVDGVDEGTPVISTGLFSPFGFQAGLDVRFDEAVYVSTVIGLGYTLEILSNDELLHLSLDIDYGVAVADLATQEIAVTPMFSAPVVSYVDFQFDYDLGPLTSLLLPPYAFGDVVMQP